MPTQSASVPVGHPNLGSCRCELIAGVQNSSFFSFCVWLWGFYEGFFCFVLICTVLYDINTSRVSRILAVGRWHAEQSLECVWGGAVFDIMLKGILSDLWRSSSCVSPQFN